MHGFVGQDFGGEIEVTGQIRADGPAHDTAQQALLNREVLFEIVHLEQDVVGHWYSVQRTQWPGLTSVSGTSSGPWQLGRFGAGQRGRKVHPVGSENGSGLGDASFFLPMDAGVWVLKEDQLFSLNFGLAPLSKEKKVELAEKVLSRLK